MRSKIIILGGGFGGLFTALQAHRRLADRAEITLIDRNDYFLFSPLLHQIVSNTLKPHHLSRPLSQLLPSDIRFVQSSVLGIDAGAQTVETESGTLPFDYLVVALGAVPNFFGMESVEQNAFPFKWLPHALHLREHFIQQFAEADAHPDRAADLLRTAVTGAGCTGIELVAELHDWMRGPLLKKHPHVPREAIDLLLVEALDHLLCPMDPILMKAAAKQLIARNIDVRFGTFVQGVSPNAVTVKVSNEIQEIPCGTVIWAAGIKPNPVISSLPGTFGPGGRILVEPTLQLPNAPHIIAMGDLAACPDPKGGFLAPTAQVAVQQAPHVARSLEALLRSDTLEPFHFKRKGEVVGLGRSAALAEAFGSRFSGVPAWLLSRAVHLARLPDWGDRAAVAWEWAKDVLRTQHPV